MSMILEAVFEVLFVGIGSRIMWKMNKDNLSYEAYKKKRNTTACFFVGIFFIAAVVGMIMTGRYYLS